MGKGLLPGACALLTLLALAGCGGGVTGRELLGPEALAEDTDFLVCYYDGEEISLSLLDDAGRRQLLSARMDPAEDRPPDELAPPVWGIRLESPGEDGCRIREAAVCGGYWITGDGALYRLRQELPLAPPGEDAFSLGTDTGWLPCARHLCRRGDRWYPRMMARAAEPFGSEAVTAEAFSWDGERLKVAFANDGEETAVCSRLCELHVRLEGVWYRVPAARMDWDTTIVDILCAIPPRTAVLAAYPLTEEYGPLPPGHYRLAWAGPAAEFEISGGAEKNPPFRR